MAVKAAAYSVDLSAETRFEGGLIIILRSYCRCIPRSTVPPLIQTSTLLISLTPTLSKIERISLSSLPPGARLNSPRCRFDTGVGKPSIHDGLPRILELPTCFACNFMHQPVINIAALLFDLWCARSDLRSADRSSLWPWAVLTGEVWNHHRKVIGRASTFLPTSFGHPPRIHKKKISSDYKAWKFLYYLYRLGPGVFLNILPQPYYSLLQTRSGHPGHVSKKDPARTTCTSTQTSPRMVG